MMSYQLNTEEEAALPKVDSAEIYRELRRRIINLDLPPGTRLREQALAREFGVSRTPIRRVLDRLTHEGLATTMAGSGASVSFVDFQQLREVWALRVKIAEMVADFVQFPAPPEVVARLRGLLKQLESLDEASALVALYDDYHEAMLQVMSNGSLRSLYDHLYAQTARMFVQMMPNLELEAEIAAIRDEISASLDACLEGSAQALAEVRTQHMHLLLARINAALTILPPPGAPAGHA